MNVFLISVIIGIIIEFIVIFFVFRFNFKGINYKGKLIKSSIIGIGLIFVLIISLLATKAVGVLNIPTQKALIAKISTDTDDCTIMVDVDKNIVLIDFNDSIQDVVPLTKQAKSNKFKKVMELPETASIENITLKEKSSEITWRSTLLTSASYINFLETEGFNKVITYSTPDFIEIYMQNENEIRRIILTETYLITSNIFDNLIIPSIEELVNICIINFENTL